MMTMIIMITMIPHLLLVWSDVIRFGAGGREGGAAIGPDSRRTCTSENSEKIAHPLIVKLEHQKMQCVSTI